MKGNRILSISFRNIKNVKNGYVDFSENSNIRKGIFPDKSGILGIYGQNGSGKTTIVNSFALLQLLAYNKKINIYDQQGNRNPSKFDYLLAVDEDAGSIEFNFLIYSNGNPFIVKYCIELFREEISGPNKISKESFNIIPYSADGKTKFKEEYAPLEFDYKVNSLSYLYDGVKHRTETTKIKQSDIGNYTLINSRKLASIESGSSVVFSGEVEKYLLENASLKVRTLGEVLYAFKMQVRFDLFVYDNQLDSLFEVGLGVLLGVYLDREKKIETHGRFKVSNYSFLIPEQAKPMYDSFIEQINIFINSFVPGFRAEIVQLSEFIGEDGKKQIEVSIIRRIGSNNGALPLSEESSGIRKLFSIACAIVKVFGSSGSWLVVDEFDSGVFEKLLGQILSVLEENGKGQVLFTAHNLRPLESIEPNSIVFTTNNPNNRYVRFPKSMIKNGSNLRTLYLRALAIGGIGEELSSDVEESQIEHALWEASRSTYDLRGESLNE